jgi:hypothetical protein
VISLFKGNEIDGFFAAMKDFYYASYFVKRFRFDDVFLGLVAKKLGVEPFHSPGDDELVKLA